jgi:PAS domain S-box-containing protein
MKSQEIRAFDGQFGFEAIIRHATIGIVVVEQDGLIKMCNPYANELFGYEENELTGSSLNLLIPEAQRQNHAHYHRDYFSNPTDRPMGSGLKLTACRKDGSIFPVEISLAHYRQQEKLTAIAFITNITRREEAEAQMRMNEQQIRMLIEHTPASIAMFDREMRYIIHSKRWLQDYRLGDKNIVGLSHYDVFPEIGDSWKKLHARCLEGEELRSPEDPFLRIDGSTDWVQWELCPPSRENDGSATGRGFS